MPSNNLLDELIQTTEPVSTNVSLNMPSTLSELISQNYPQQEFRDLDMQNLQSEEYNDMIMSLVEGVTTGNIPLPIASILKGIASKKGFKSAKEAGEEMMTLFRGVPDWFPGKMVKGGKFVGGTQQVSELAEKSRWGSDAIHTAPSMFDAISYATRKDWINQAGSITGKYGAKSSGAGKKPFLFEFEVPKSYIEKSLIDQGLLKQKLGKFLLKGILEGKSHEIAFKGGLPKTFLKKVTSLE